MSDIPAANNSSNLSHSDEEAVVDVLKSSVDNINYISSDSASTFEYVDEKLYHQQQLQHQQASLDNFSPIETIDYDDVVASMPLAPTKEEKQRHNEEIAVMDSMASTNNNSNSAWESLPKTSEESCLLFLRSERNLSLAENSTPSKSAKPCFIDASSLLDEEDLIYTPPPSAAHRPYSAVNMHQLRQSFDAEDKDDNTTNTATCYDIKDQYSAIDKTPVTRSPNIYSPVRMFHGSRENEKLQGNMIFQSSIQQYSGHLIKQQQQQQPHLDDVYTSDMSSIQSAYSSASGGDVGHSRVELNSHYNSLVENTSDYNSSFSRTQSDNDSSSIVLPDTPFNSIVQVASQQLKIFEEGDLLDGNDEQASRPAAATTNPIKIPKRAMKYDEFAPVLSGGASVKDFTPKQCESPNLRRRTDTCPIVSGGSVDLMASEERSATPKAAARRSSTSSSSQSWVVDFNELKIKEDEDDEGEERTRSKRKAELVSSGAKSLDYASQSMGFYVDFGSLRESSAESAEAEIRKEPPRPAPRQKPTGFYVDLTSPAATNVDKNVVAETQPAVQQSNGVEKKNMFSMFIDFNADAAGTVVQKVNNVSSSASSDDKSPPPPPATANSDAKNGKKSCYMFIESDSPVVRRRQIVAAAVALDSSKRHSWNVNQDEPSEAQRAAKTYQRSTSVSNEKGVMNILDKIPSLLSKTSSMSIDSSVSPYEDFSCSKSFSSYSTNSATTHSSNSSIEQSGTKVQVEGAGGDVMTASAKKRRKDAKINETFDKSSQGSVTEGILSNDDASSTDTDDVTFQNQELEGDDKVEIKRDTSTSDFKAAKMETIPEIAENSPMKRANAEAKQQQAETLAERDEEFKIETHTMESLQALIEKQKQLLENAESPSSNSVSFVRLSDLDKPIKQNIYENSTTSQAAVNGNNNSATNNNASSMSNSTKVSRMLQDASSAGHRSLTLQTETKTPHNWNMSRSTGNNSLSTLASSVENFRSLTRLFPHLTDGEQREAACLNVCETAINFKIFHFFGHLVISTSVPNNVSMNSFDQSFIDRLEFISSDFSCTSSVTSSRSGMGM